jgi:acetyl-CoA carboxylase biotin carboxyl carrier protein
MAKFEMDTDFIRKLAAILEETGLGEIELADGERKIRVARPTTVAPAAAPIAVAPMVTSAGPVAVVPVALAATADLGSHPGAVKSPMVGTAYLRPSPESKAFVEVGSLVKSGEKIMLVEAMKTYNEIVAPRAGKITHIFVEDGSPVEYGQALMVIE